MFRIAQFLLLILYAVLPVAMIYFALRRRPGLRFGPLLSVIFTYLCGIAIGTGLLILNAKLLGGRLQTVDGLRFIYFVIAALCLLKFTDRLLLRAAFRIARVGVDLAGRPLAPNRPRAVLCLLLQRLMMLLLIIPYVFALIVTCRPKLLLDGSPRVFGLDYAGATFVASDGANLNGWWIPAKPMPSRPLDDHITEQWARRTIILCHGLASGKEQQLPLASLLARRGFNVLAFDFRAHGQSAGSFFTYGDRERRDALAAVRWVKANHPQQAQRILGIGSNTGAAALLAAAADPDDGQLIDALVLYQPFARFSTLADITADQLLPQGIRWLVRNVSLPLASLHAGSDLAAFAPADYVQHIWPRPILVVHGRGQTFVPTSEEMDLYRQIPQPKQQFWPSDNHTSLRARLRRAHDDSALLIEMLGEWLGTRDPISSDPAVQYRTLRFLRDARPIPVL